MQVMASANTVLTLTKTGNYDTLNGRGYILCFLNYVKHYPTTNVRWSPAPHKGRTMQPYNKL